MNCINCNSNKIKKIDTKISDFLVARIFGEEEVSNTYNVSLCNCEEGTFSFYDRRLTDEESNRLYDGDRNEKYQMMREKYDCWYTKKLNNAMNNDEKALKEQQRIIEKIIKENISKEIKVALDYGGNEGATFTELIGTEEKYVYDISSKDIVRGGVKRIGSYVQLFEHDFDFIMCNHTLEHISYPNDFMKLLYDIGSENTYYYIEVPSKILLWKISFLL